MLAKDLIADVWYQEGRDKLGTVSLTVIAKEAFRVVCTVIHDASHEFDELSSTHKDRGRVGVLHKDHRPGLLRDILKRLACVHVISEAQVLWPGFTEIREGSGAPTIWAQTELKMSGTAPVENTDHEQATQRIPPDKSTGWRKA